MMVAQQLYEGIALGKQGTVGLITYMRTDSTRIADSAKAEALNSLKRPTEMSSQHMAAAKQKYARCTRCP